MISAARNCFWQIKKTVKSKIFLRVAGVLFMFCLLHTGLGLFHFAMLLLTLLSIKNKKYLLSVFCCILLISKPYLIVIAHPVLTLVIAIGIAVFYEHIIAFVYHLATSDDVQKEKSSAI